MGQPTKLRTKTGIPVPQNFEFLRNLITTEQLAEALGVTFITVTTWRDRHGLPYKILPGANRASVRYDFEEVKKWAEENGRVFVMDPREDI